jgi:PEP-CTERM motif
MSHRFLRVLAVALMLMGVSVIAAPGTGHATTIQINSVTVSVGPASFSSIWSFPVVLAEGQSLLLSQTGVVANAYNFDTSDICIPASNCTTSPTITVATSVGNFIFTDTGNVLSSPAGVDTSANPPLETREYVAGTQTGGAGTGLSLGIGYADDAHFESPHTACSATGVVDTPIINCRPDPFSATFVQATLISGGCLAANGSFDGRSCIDAGVLRFVNTTNPPRVPEPSTLFLLGGGLLSLAVWGRRAIKG